MNYIKKVVIDDFWLDKKVEINFSKNENFLIGVNGSGKTTIINLIVGSITANFNMLDRAEFSKITIFFSPLKVGSGSIKVIITKSLNVFTEFADINLSIYKGRSKFREYNLNELEEDRLLRNKLWHSTQKVYYHNKKDLLTELKKILNVSWLSIHRSKEASRFLEDKNLESFVDLKISEFSKAFSGYLAELAKKSNDQTDKFQKSIFLSLIETQSENAFVNTINKINFDKELSALKEIYTLFKLDKTEYNSKINNYFKNFEKAKTNLGSSQLNFVDAEHLIGIKRIHTIIEKWNSLLIEQESILSSQNSFIKLINELFQRKTIKINERNELYIETQSGKEFSIYQLSSGEKQLIILFGEALLQRNTPHVFIADEPELSLHVEWQEKLVKNLKILNPQAQMIFATHSPDIVSEFSKSVIKIEKCIK